MFGGLLRFQISEVLAFIIYIIWKCVKLWMSRKQTATNINNILNNDSLSLPISYHSDRSAIAAIISLKLSVSCVTMKTWLVSVYKRHRHSRKMQSRP